MLGVVFAAGAMGMSVYTGSHIPDALGSIAIGGLLGGVATFMIVTNTNSLVGKSIPEEKINSINEELEGETTLPGGQINGSSSEKQLFCSSQQLPGLRLGPLKGFLSWHGALQGPLACLVCCSPLSHFVRR